MVKSAQARTKGRNLLQAILSESAHAPFVVYAQSISEVIRSPSLEEHLLVRELTHRINNEFATAIEFVRSGTVQCELAGGVHGSVGCIVVIGSSLRRRFGCTPEGKVTVL